MVLTNTVLCSICGFDIPPGETYDPEYPKCDGCKGWSDEDDLKEGEDMNIEDSYHEVRRINNVVTLFICNDLVAENPEKLTVLNYCPYCGEKIEHRQFKKLRDDEILDEWD